MKEIRLFRIIYCLIEKRKTTVSELTERFEVSVRTICGYVDVISRAGVYNINAIVSWYKFIYKKD